jgi:steroid 5-alpha reductase family enzyme
MDDFGALVFQAAIKGLAFDGAIFALLWTASTLVKYTDLLDIYWAFGFFSLSLVYISTFQAATNALTLSTPLVLMLCMVLLWGVRLSAFTLFRQFSRGWKEDARYAYLREKNGESFWWRSFYLLMIPQLMLHWITSFSLLVSIAAGFAITTPPANKLAISIFDMIGCSVWLCGFVIESVADWQMWSFKKEPKNKDKILFSGLWGVCRHPNYLGDIMIWCGFFFMSLNIILTPLTSLSPWMLALALLSPLAMTWMLTRYSGIKMAEEIILNHKPGYRAYQQRVPALLPSLDFKPRFKYQHLKKAISVAHTHPVKVNAAH